MVAQEALKLAEFPPEASLTDQEELELIQLDYFRKHLDVFVEYAFRKINLKPIQKTLVRAIGNYWDIKICFSRGAGKTWVVAVAAFALCCLYPGTVVRIVSKSVDKANETLNKISKLAEVDPDFANEIDKGAGRSLVHMDKDGGWVNLKNGSVFEASAILSMRSHRAKIIIRDEDVELDQELVRPIVMPVLNYTREIAMMNGIEDYPSKSISMTSCCEQSNGFFNEFMKTYAAFIEGRPGKFACCLDYRCAVDNGINSEAYFEEARMEYPQQQFDQEFGSIFLSSVDGTVLPYGLTDPCRTLHDVELAQAKNSKARYVIGLDIATSAAKGADNSIIAVLKFRELQDGRFARKLVYLQSFHGEGLDVLAKRVQELYHINFPNAEKIVFDARGVGDAFALFCNNEFIDLVTGREYPPLVVDDEPNYNDSAIPALHPFRAVLSLNQRLYSNMLYALDKKLIELPINSRSLANGLEGFHQLPLEERLVYTEADELQREMSHIVRKEGPRGVTYDTPSNRFHKDRYSAVAMANDYIAELEKENMKYANVTPCLGVVSNF